MLVRIIATITLSANLAVAPAIASDWVEDDQLNGFYKHQVNKTSGQPDPSYQPVRTRKPQYRTLGGPQDSNPSVFDTSNNYGRASSRNSGSMGSSNSGSMGSFASPLTVPARPSQYESSNLGNQTKKKGFFGKLGSFGKSVAQIPADAVEGAGAMLSSPLFWQSAGALAGAGANAYMTNQYYKNNPGAFNPYNNGFGGYGNYNPYYGGYGTPGMGFGGMGYGGLYGGRRFGNTGLGYSGLNNGRGFGNTGLGYGGLYGGRGFGNTGLYGGYNPYLGRGLYGNYAAPGSLNQFGSLAPSTPASRAFRNNYNRQVTNSGLSQYDQYWLKKNPNYSLFGY